MFHFFWCYWTSWTQEGSLIKEDGSDMAIIQKRHCTKCNKIQFRREYY